MAPLDLDSRVDIAMPRGFGECKKVMRMALEPFKRNDIAEDVRGDRDCTIFECDAFHPIGETLTGHRLTGVSKEENAVISSTI